MSNDTIRDLLHEVADGVEPGDRLDAIRAATSGERRTGRGWWAAGGVGLVAASVVTAVALSTGGTPQGDAPGPADTPSTTPSSPPTSVPVAPTSEVVAVYYVGDTPDGPRLYREFRRVEGDALSIAVAAAVGRDADGRPLAPLDSDYRVPWTPMTSASASVDAAQDLITISLGGDPQDSLRDRGPLTEAEAGLAVEQLIRTAQGAVGERLPVRFLLFGEITDQVLGVPTSEPLAAGSDLEVLAHVSLSNPTEGHVVDNDGGLVVDGVGNSYEGNIVISLERAEDSEVVLEVPTIAGTYEDRLFPFMERLDLSDVPAGEYVVVARTDDPSGEGRFDIDTRQITVVD